MGRKGHDQASHPSHAAQHPKAALNELPVHAKYQETALGGHKPAFVSKVTIDPFETKAHGVTQTHPGIKASAVGSSKQDAQTKAASQALGKMHDVAGSKGAHQ